jgi:subtilase family serine protease
MVGKASKIQTNIELEAAMTSRKKVAFLVPLSSLTLMILVSALALAQSNRVTTEIDDRTVTLKGNVSPRARAEFDQGRVDSSTTLTGLQLMFRPAAAQQAAIKRLLAAQQDRTSPYYHKWITPEQYADRFGLSREDIEKVVKWLESQGFEVTEIAHGRCWVVFSGTAEQVERVFRTELHRYNVDGEAHFANTTAPSIPKALAGMVSDFRGLNDFYPKPSVSANKIRPINSLGPNPDYTTGASNYSNYLGPGDLAINYDFQQYYLGVNNKPDDGAGLAIAVVGQSEINLSDIDNFSTFFSSDYLSVQPTINEVYYTGTAPSHNGSEVEADLDLETVWGVAPASTIYFVTGPSADGAAAYVIDNHTTIPASVITESFGICEPQSTQTSLAQQETIAEMGNMEGITWVASSGDSGAADCEPSTSSSATTGLAVNEPASLPGVTGVGGTEFYGDVANPSQYWLTENGSGNVNATLAAGSPSEHDPEMVWNDSITTGNGVVLDTCTSDCLSASGGGASVAFAKPSWQVGPGVPDDNARDVPDISMAASANHDGYLIFCSASGCNIDTPNFYGGTSAATPLFAGIVLLINDFLVQQGYQPSPGLGNVNPTLYNIAKNKLTGLNIAFYDVTTGSNIVPCTPGSPNCPTSPPYQFGYSAGVGYDQATGLGSVDAFNLGMGFTLIPNFQLSVEPSSVTIAAGQSGTAMFTVAPQNGFDSQVSFSVTGCPTEAICTFNPTSVTPQSGAATSTLTITTTAPSATMQFPFVPSHRPIYAFLFPGLAMAMTTMFGMAVGRRRALYGVRLCGLLVILTVAPGLISCGGGTGTGGITGGGNPGTPAGPYTVSVSATTSGSGTLSQAATLSITITP